MKSLHDYTGAALEANMPAETNDVLTRKVFDPVDTHFTPGERSMVAWISTDCVDHERDVVVSSGIDYKTYFLGKTPEEGNPCVLAFHDLGRWPLGRCEWIKSKNSREFNGLYAKTLFDDDPETESVWRKIKSRSLRGISIGFRPPDDLKPGEWGPPTREELLRRPDWKKAERIIRRCVLLEYSVCSLPMNPQALVAAVNKGVHRPVYSLPKALPMPTDTTPATPGGGESEAPDLELEAKSVEAEPEAKAPCECGKAECKECGERMKLKDSEEDEAAEETEAKAADADPDEADPSAEPESDPDDFDEEDEEALPVKTGDHVDVKSRGFKGCGVVEKIHRKGLVDHVDEDMIGTKDDPAARVRLYKAHGDGHAPSGQKRPFKLKELTRRSERFKEPSKAKSVAQPTTKNSPMGEKPEPLPVIVVKSDQEVRAELVAKLNHMLSPEGFRKIAREEAERAAGFV